MSQHTLFRQWINNLWYEHKRECLMYNGKPVDYDITQYVTRYKWWLKREFKRVHGVNHGL